MATHDIGRLGSSTDTILDLTAPGRSNGSDMYNDLTDVVPSQNIETFDNGTDEAGNPILGSRANDYVEQQAKAQPQSGSYAQRFATNFSNYFGRKYNDVSPAELEQYQAALDANPEGTLLFGGKPQIDLAEELSPVTWANAAKDFFGSIDSVKSGRLYANLFYGKDEYCDRILKINRITGVKMDDLINNDDAYRTMNQLVMRIEKLEKLPGFLKTNGKLDMDKVYKELPYLAAVQEKQGDTAAALALTHAAGLKSINDVYHNEFTRFAASVGYGLYKGGMNVYKQWTTGKAMARALTGGDGNLTDAEKNDLQWANNQIQSTPEFAFDSVGSAFGGMIGGAAENLPLIATSQGAKTAVKFAIRQGVKKIPVVGTALGKVADKIGNRALDVIGDISSVAAMSAGIGANQYEENLYKLDSACNRMYTPREAAAVSMVQGVAEGVMEQYSLKQIGRAIAGGGKVIELNNLYRKGALLRTAEGRGELREQVASLVSERIGDMVKAGAVSMGAELQEEFSQQVADMVIENIAQVGLRGENAEVASFGDILQESTVAALQAMHSIAGFGVAGFMLHPVAHLRPIVTARGQIQQMMDNEAYRSVHVNQYQMNVIEGVGNNLKDISDLQKKSPETVNNILDVQNRKFGVEYTEVDVHTLMQEPGGSDIVTRIAEQGNISQEEMQACVDGHGMLKVKTSALQQLIPDMDGKQKEALLGNVTKNSTYKTDNQVVKEREVAIRQKAAIKKLMQEEVGNAIENVVKARFSDDADEAALAREILEANFDDPLAEVKQRLARANMELQEAIGTTVSRLRTSMKYPEQAQNEYEAAWSQNWTDDHEGQKITDRELEELAVDIVSGREDPRYSIDAVDMENMTDEERQQLENTGVQLDELLTLRNRLAAVQEKMNDLKPGDLVATRVLSADGQAVFQQLKNEFASKTGSDKAKKSADFNAIMWARYCEERAKAFAEATKKPYTAMDYYRERLRMNLAAEHQPLKENLEKAAQLMEMWDVSVSGIDSLPKFYDRVLERKEGEEEPNKIQYTNKYGITFAEQQVVHAVNTHGLTKDDLADIDAHIDKFYNVNHSGWADGDYAGNFNGTSILARVDGKSQSYYVVIEIDDNGVAWFKTAAKNSKDGADKKIEEHSSGRLSDLGDETAGTTGSASSIENIKQKLGIVNKITKKNKKWRVIYNGDNALKQNNAAKGSVTFSEGNPEKVLNLFETADQSTAMHEMAHVYLLDLQELANIAGPDSLYAKDLKTIMDWASWQEGQIDDYIGTATASEFLKRDSEIRAAKNAGDTAKAEELEKVWAQERFARGFEEYLEKGTAPTMGLQKAFRAFKRWLCNIYKGFLGVGGRATPEVEAVMARMIASEEEIETLSTANNIARLEKIDPEVFNTELGRMLRRWENEAKEEAKEKLLKALLKEYRELDVEGHLKEYRERMEEEMKDHHCFAVQRLVEEGATLENALATFGYASQDEYEADLKRYGKSYEAAIEKAVQAERERYKRTPVQQQALYDKALEALASGKYDTQMAELEAEILKRQQSKYNALPAKVADAFLKVDDARAAEEVKTIKKNLVALRYAQRWNDTETNMLREMEDRLMAKDITAEEILAEFDAKYDAFKKTTIENEEWIRKEWLFGVRDAAVGKSEAIRNEVRSLMAEMPVSAAINFRLWNRKALLEGNKAWKELSKAQNKATNEPSQDEKENARNAAASKRYVRNAEQAKLNQATFSAMALEAVRIKQKIIIPMLNKIKKRQKTMSGKNFKMDANCRYFHDHLLYVYGLRASDARKPTGEDARTFAAWLLDMKDIGQFDEEIPEVIRVAMATDDQLKDYRQLTYPELQSISDFCTMLYTIGKNQNVRLTDGVSMEQVEADCTKDFIKTISYEVGRQKINQVKGAIGKYIAGLMKTETMLSILGGKEGAYIKYIYKTLADAADAEERAREKEAVAEKELVRTYYTRSEMRKICNDDLMVTDADGKKHRFELGDDKHITKENILCMALNWGNEGNRVRLCNGLEMSEREVMDIMQQFMTEKDWQFVQAMWNHIEEFADPVSNVIEKLTGLPMKRVKGDAFTVNVGDGKEIQLSGGYYPIVYDNGKSLRQSTFEQMEQAQSMGGASVLGVGMGSTKDRASDNYKGHGPLLLELRAAHSHIQGQIHIIHSKLAVRDAYKVIADQTVANQIRNTFGANMYDVMRENVLSCWQAPMKPREWYDDMVGKIRRNSVGAIMSYRLSTALLNLANIVYMINEIGAINSIHALFDYYDPRNWKNNRELIMNNSVFMRNRSTNMDRDLNATAEELFGHNNILTNKLADLTGEKSTEAMRLIDKYSSKAIEWTDMIFSMPLYFWQFKQTYNELILDPNKSEVEAREEANYQATRLVTKVFSSNRTIDTSQVQRSRNEIVRLFTPFFSFSNMMMNAVWSKYYEGKYQKNDADGMFARFKARWGRFLASAFLDYMVGAFVETCLREGINSLTGSGDKDDWWDRVKKNYWKNATSAATGGFPVLNLITDPFSEMVVTALRDEKLSYKYGNRGSAGVIGGAIDRVFAPFQDAAKILAGNKKIDTLDMMRDVVKASDSFTGFSDTLVDAMFNTIRFATDEGYSLDNMDDLREYIAKSMFDRKLKKRQ